MISVSEWQQALREADISHHVKATLYILSTYADWTTGEHIRPGELIQKKCRIPRKTAYNHTKLALEAGWLVQTYSGGAGSGNRWANEYRLAVPEKHVSPMTHASEDAQKHESPMTHGHESPVADGHESPVTRHLDIAPNHSPRHGDEKANRAEGSPRGEAIELLKEYAELTGQAPGDIENDLRAAGLKVREVIVWLRSSIDKARAA